MGWTSENVAKDFHVTREEQDIFAAESFQKAEQAQKNGYFSEEIVPFTVLRQEDSANRESVMVWEDDGIRYGTTADSLSKIKAAFPHWGNGTTTGGNASQITDGAAAVLVMTRREAERRCLPILGKHIRTAVTGMYIELLF
jgi:acetyl-CoA acetyltransferase